MSNIYLRDLIIPIHNSALYERLFSLWPALKPNSKPLPTIIFWLLCNMMNLRLHCNLSLIYLFILWILEQNLSMNFAVCSCARLSPPVFWAINYTHFVVSVCRLARVAAAQSKPKCGDCLIQMQAEQEQQINTIRGSSDSELCCLFIHCLIIHLSPFKKRCEQVCKPHWGFEQVDRSWKSYGYISDF